ncbi:Uncharacterised protein [Mycobacteroides abscessus]|nr:Uncharacterised protein [Mycobacteroides abscessus]
MTTCTAAASVSRRRVRSSVKTVPTSAIRVRSQAVSAAVPSPSVVAASCSACVTWRRSVR